MSVSSKDGDGPRCVACQKPFGFPVAFCPFCGDSQRALLTNLKLAAVEPPGHASSLVDGPVAPSGDGAVGPVHGPIDEPMAPPPPVATARPKRRTWLWGLAVVLLMVGIEGVALLMRHSPMATLIVSVSPNAPGIVTIDGMQAGPPGQSLRLSSGTHSMSFVAKGWLAASRQISLSANQQAIVTIELTPQPATLVLSHDPADAVLRLDDRVIDASRSELPVPPGRHRLTATRPGYTPIALTLTLERGERRVVPLIMAPLVVKDIYLQALVGNWSQPVALPPKTDFTLALSGRIRLRIGQEVYFVGSGGSINLGDVRGQSLQVKAVDDQPVDVHLFLKPEG